MVRALVDMRFEQFKPEWLLLIFFSFSDLKGFYRPDEVKVLSISYECVFFFILRFVTLGTTVVYIYRKGESLLRLTFHFIVWWWKGGGLIRGIFRNPPMSVVNICVSVRYLSSMSKSFVLDSRFVPQSHTGHSCDYVARTWSSKAGWLVESILKITE